MLSTSFDTLATPVKVGTCIVSFSLCFVCAHIVTATVVGSKQPSSQIISNTKLAKWPAQAVKNSPTANTKPVAAKQNDFETSDSGDTNLALTPYKTSHPTDDNRAAQAVELSLTNPGNQIDQPPIVTDHAAINNASYSENITIIDPISDIVMSTLPPDYDLVVAQEQLVEAPILNNTINAYPAYPALSASTTPLGIQENGEPVIVLDVNTLSDVEYSATPPGSDLD